MLPLALPAQTAPPGLGWVSGVADASYSVEASGPAPLNYENNGFRQSVQAAPGGWTVSVRVAAAPLKVRSPFRLGRLPAGLGLSAPRLAELRALLGSAQRADEAVNAVMLFLRTRIAYSERPDFDETPQAVFTRSQASCVGLTRAAMAVLAALGISCREVLGLRVPPGQEQAELRGGLLHAWLEVDYPDAGSAFYDPLRSCGWVEPGYIVLSRGGGLAPGSYAAYAGGKVLCVRRRDRIFFEPASGERCVLWARSPFQGFTGTLVSGKVLGEADAPETGRATLSGGSATVTMELWEGNFFFRDLDPGSYLLTVAATGGRSAVQTLRLSGMDKHHLVFYSQADGAIKAGDPDELGR